MIPLAHVVARKRLNDKRMRNVQDLSPHTTRPLVGLRKRQAGTSIAETSKDVGETLQPTAVYVDIHVEKDTTVYKILMTHELPPLLPTGIMSVETQHVVRPPTELDFYFPVSECGKFKSMKVTFNQRELRGELLRESRLDSKLVPVTTAPEHLPPAVDDDDDDQQQAQSKGVPSSPPVAVGSKAKVEQVEIEKKKKELKGRIYYYRVPFVQRQLSEYVDNSSGSPSRSKYLTAQGKQKIDVIVEVHVKTIEKKALERYRVLFPLLCLPQPPASLRCTMNMPADVRRVWSTNQRHQIQAFLNNQKADFSLIFTPQNPLHLEDYIFDIEVQLGEAIVAECIDPVSLLILATALGMMVFHILTRDLRDEW